MRWVEQTKGNAAVPIQFCHSNPVCDVRHNPSSKYFSITLFFYYVFDFRKEELLNGHLKPNSRFFWINEPVRFPLPSSGWNEVLLFQLQFACNIRKFVAPHESCGSPVPEDFGLVFILESEKKKTIISRETL